MSLLIKPRLVEADIGLNPLIFSWLNIASNCVYQVGFGTCDHDRFITSQAYCSNFTSSFDFWQQDVSIIDHLQSYEQTEVEGLRLIFPNSKR